MQGGCNVPEESAAVREMVSENGPSGQIGIPEMARGAYIGTGVL